MLRPVIRQGRELDGMRPELPELRGRFLENLKSLPVECQRRVNPQVYWVGLSRELFELRGRLLEQAHASSNA
jgi:hypothetical protein